MFLPRDSCSSGRDPRFTIFEKGVTLASPTGRTRYILRARSPVERKRNDEDASKDVDPVRSSQKAIPKRAR